MAGTLLRKVSMFALALAASLAVAPAAAAWVPEDGKIAFVSTRDGDWEIYSMLPDGTEQTRLTNDAGLDREPTWSPDGSKIAFSTTRHGNSEIYVMNADGSGATRITSTPEFERDPAWSPDGTRIAFTVNVPPHGYEVHVMDPDGGNRARLTTNTWPDSSPRWSPDGSKIAFVSEQNGFSDSEIHVMNADGTGEVNVSNSPDADYEPAWSPDGSKIAFRSNRVDYYDVWVMDANGANPTRLTTNGSVFYDGAPTWSPDGSKIAFYQDQQIALMDPDGANQTTITSSTGSNGTPVWSGELPHRPQVAVDDSLTVAQDSAVTAVDVLANDSSPDDPVSVASVGGASHGTAVLDGGVVKYTPARGYCGRDAFEYELNLGARARVNVTVTCKRPAQRPGGQQPGAAGPLPSLPQPGSQTPRTIDLTTVLSHRRVALDRGRIRLRFICRGTAGQRCRGKATLRATSRRSRLGRSAAAAPSARFDVAAGRTQTLWFKPTRRMVKVLRVKRKLIVRVRFALRGGRSVDRLITVIDRRRR